MSNKPVKFYSISCKNCISKLWKPHWEISIDTWEDIQNFIKNLQKLNTKSKYKLHYETIVIALEN